MLRNIVFIAAFWMASMANAQYAPENEDALALAQAGDLQAAWDIWKPLADAGDARAQSNIGTMYDKGLLVTQDKREALRWFLLSAEAGFDTGQFNLGIMYETGRGVAQNYTQSFRWFLAAARQENPHAALGVARAYLHGNGVPSDFARVYMWMALAAEIDPDVAGDFFEGLEARLGKAAVIDGRALLEKCKLQGLERCE